MIAANEIAQVPAHEMMSVLRDLGASTCRTTMPDLDHVGTIIQAGDEAIVLTANELGSCPVKKVRVPKAERANEPLSLPLPVASALVRGEPRAYDRVRSVLRAPFN